MAGGRILGPLLLLPLLGGCTRTGFRLFDPAGPVASASLTFTLLDILVMSLIILPTTGAIAVFIWRYRKAANAHYDPEWSHSLPIELLVWGVPILIVAALAFVSYNGTMATNPFGPTALASTRAGAPPAEAPLEIDVITTDWQWLFVYPAQRIASIDEVVVPEGRNVTFRMTSTSVTNDFFIPQLAPMIDIMPGMVTSSAMRADRLGTFRGFSADFSGAGFAWMQFATRVVPAADFPKWVDGVRSGAVGPNRGDLTYAAFEKLAHPTLNLNATPSYFSAVDPDLFDKTRMAAMQGVVYAVPGDLTENMTPKSSPPTSKASGS